MEWVRNLQKILPDYQNASANAKGFSFHAGMTLLLKQLYNQEILFDLTGLSTNEKSG